MLRHAPTQAASSPAKEKAELAEKQAELDKALHSYRSGALSAEKARQAIAQVCGSLSVPQFCPFAASTVVVCPATSLLAAHHTSGM